MNRQTPSAPLLAWCTMLGATVMNWLLKGDAGPAGRAVILTIALLKVRLVIRYFMEVRDAPRALGFILDGWLAVVALSLMLQPFYMLDRFG